MNDIRCPICKQLLLKAKSVQGEIKCIKCKKIIKLDIPRQSLEPHNK